MRRPRRRPRRIGSIHHESISDYERDEYFRTGMIRAKAIPVRSSDRGLWPYGCYRNIDIRGILGDEYPIFLGPDDELEPTLPGRVLSTNFGIIVVADVGYKYLLEVLTHSRRAVLDVLRGNGCDAAFTGAYISVYKEELFYE